MNALIVCALKQESQGHFETLGFPVIYTGVGKINASMNLLAQIIYRRNKPFTDVIINLGTVGSGTIPETKIVQISSFVQRDMLCEPLVPRYYTPFEPDGGPIKLTKYTDLFDLVSCGTGDSFVSSEELKVGSLPYDVVDMEGFAMAAVCRALDIPFISLKFVSDSGESESWERNLEKAAKALTIEARNLLADLIKNPFYAGAGASSSPSSSSSSSS